MRRASARPWGMEPTFWSERTPSAKPPFLVRYKGRGNSAYLGAVLWVPARTGSVMPEAVDRS